MKQTRKAQQRREEILVEKDLKMRPCATANNQQDRNREISGDRVGAGQHVTMPKNNFPNFTMSTKLPKKIEFVLPHLISPQGLGTFCIIRLI
jgi:hypothetical protein